LASGTHAFQKTHIIPASVAKKASRRCSNKDRIAEGRSVTSPNDQFSDFGPAQLALFVAAAIVLLFFAWSFFQ
jgi:hypothetical protein